MARSVVRLFRSQIVISLRYIILVKVDMVSLLI